MDIPADEELLASIQKGDTGSLTVLVQRWERPLFRFVYRMLPRKEEAQDICQETFLRILSKAKLFHPGGKFSTWMYQIALNLTRDHMRKKGRWAAVVVDGGEAREERSPTVVQGAPVTPDSVLVENDRRAVVRRALTRLPVEQREVLVLKEFQGLKFREIAEILGCPESTVKSRMYYGLKSLKTELVREGGTDGLQ